MTILGRLILQRKSNYMYLQLGHVWCNAAPAVLTVHVTHWLVTFSCKRNTTRTTC